MKAKGFPGGWKFVFHRQRNHPRNGPCLVLLAPNGMRRYREVAKAINHNKKLLKNISASAFYKYIGLDEEMVLEDARSVDGNGECGPSALFEAQTYKNQLSKLRRNACGICIMCDKSDCGNCVGCSLNDNSAGENRTICLHKVRPDKFVWTGTTAEQSLTWHHSRTALLCPRAGRDTHRLGGVFIFCRTSSG